MTSTVQIAWVAGLLEGEASFCMSGRSITIAIMMTDRDVIDRAANLLGGRVYGPVDRRCLDKGHRPIWRTQVKGPRAAAWMMTIYRLLGLRRRSQVALALRRWRAMKYVRISPGTERSIIEAWDAGVRVKTQLGRRFNVSRETVYRILLDNQRIERLCEASVTITPIDIAWLAGLIEGEGNISINGRSLTLRVKMGDRDIISRAADLLETRVHSATVSGPNEKPMWLAQVKSSTAAAWIMTLYPWLGARRRKQARDALAFWRRQGHGAIAESLAAAILSYRKARFSQAEIMAIFKVSKSTVYRHTKDKVRRMRVTAHHGRPHQVRERPRSYNAGLAYLTRIIHERRWRDRAGGAGCASGGVDETRSRRVATDPARRMEPSRTGAADACRVVERPLPRRTLRHPPATRDDPS